MPLSPRKARFVEEYLLDLNATRAAIRAGYSEHSAKQQGCNLLAEAEVAAAVAERQTTIAEKLGVTAGSIIAELAKLGFANMSDYMKVDGDGYPHLDFGALSRDQAAALTEVTVEQFTDGAGEDAREVKRVKFRLADKRAALVDLGKHLGLFIDRHEIDHNLKIISDKPLTADEWEQRYATAVVGAPAGTAKGSH